MSKALRCVVAVKRTALAAGGRSLAARSARALHAAHAEHERTLAAVREALRARGLRFREVRPFRLRASDRRALEAAHLVICVGGDGTLLTASHHVGRGVVLGVNSAPGDSVGHFCGTDRARFARTLDGFLAGRRRPMALARLEVRVDGRLALRRVLNDALVCHASPAATTRYEIARGASSEIHRSSGIWIATAAGSTAAIRSAGGRALPRRSRRLQYLVRELYREPGRSYRLIHGFVAEDRELVVVSRMPQGRLFADGARLSRPFPFGASAVFSIGSEPLNLLA